MADEATIRGFRAFGLPVDPDPAFSSVLYDQLAAELGFDVLPLPALVPPIVRRPRSGRAAGPWGDRLADRLPRGRRGPPGHPRGRGPGGRVADLPTGPGGGRAERGGDHGRPDGARAGPVRAGERSRAAYKNPPAFTMTYKDPEGQRWQLAADGAGTWRVDPLDWQPGAYSLYDGTRIGTYQPDLETWGVTAAARPWRPSVSARASSPGPAWCRTRTPTTFETVPCAQATWVGREEVAARRGRPRPLRRQRHRLLAGHSRPGSCSACRPVPRLAAGKVPCRAGAGHRGHRVRDRSGRCGALRVGGARRCLPGVRPAGQQAAQGRRGRPNARGNHGGRQAVHDRTRNADGGPVHGTWGRGDMREAFDAAASAVTGVRSMVVQANPPGTVAGYLAGHPTSSAVVADPETALGEAWRINFVYRDGAPRRPGAGRRAGQAADERGRRPGAARGAE